MLKRLRSGHYDRVIAERLRDGTAVRPGERRAEAVPPPPTEPALDSPPAPAPPLPGAQGPRAFGDGIVSQKPLDEVILEYLVEKARDRAGDHESKAASRSRKKG
jgi:hypothetical protein